MRKPALIFIFITLFLDILGIGLIVPVLPRLIANYTPGGGSLDEAALTYGTLASAYALMQFLFAPILGSLSDRFGRRPVILFSLFGSAVDYLLLAFAPSLTWFFIGRIISGITGANFSAATAYIADITPPEKRAASFGLVGAAFGLGFIVGPLAGGFLSDYGLHIPFIAASILTMVNWCYGLFVLPESLAPENRGKFSWAKANPVGGLLNLSKYPMLIGLAIAYFVLTIAHQVYPSIWVLYTAHRYDWTPKEAGWSLAVVGFCAALVQGGLTRKVVPKWGEPKAILIGVVVAVIAFTGYGLAAEGWMIYPLIVFGSIAGVTTPALQAVISKGSGADEQGGVQGTLTSLNSVAGIIGPFVATGLFHHYGKSLPGAPFFCGAALNVIALLIAWRAMRRVLGKATS
jgi:MFS transporter, DHA1 family, tetracycline resistance protein